MACSRVSLAIGGRTPKASAVRKMMVRGCSPQPDGTAPGMKLRGYEALVFSVRSRLQSGSSAHHRSLHFHKRSKTDCRPDLWFILGTEIDALSITAALEIEDPILGPAMFIVTDQATLRTGRRVGLTRGGKAKKRGHIPIPALVGRAMHGQHSLGRQQVVHDAEHGLFDFSTVVGAANKH